MTQRGLPKPPIHDQQFSYQWREWLRRTYVRIAEAAQILWTQIDKTGSNLIDLETRRHRDLQDLQGGTTAEYYHMTSAQHTEVTGFFAATNITGAEAETLSDGSNADALHVHSGGGFDIDDLLLTPGDALITDGNGNALIGDP